MTGTTTVHMLVTCCTVSVGCRPTFHSLHHHPLLLLHLSLLGATEPGRIFPDHNVITVMLLAPSTLEYVHMYNTYVTLWLNHFLYEGMKYMHFSIFYDWVHMFLMYCAHSIVLKLFPLRECTPDNGWCVHVSEMFRNFRLPNPCTLSCSETAKSYESG